MTTKALTRLARTVVATQHRLVPTTTLVLRSAHRAFITEAVVPPEDYYNGHLMADHLEYLDDMLDKTIKIENVMEDLKETYRKKKHAYENVGWMESPDIDALFATASHQKQDLSARISELKELIQKSKATFAVDAPDGVSDVEVRRIVVLC